LRCRPFRSDPDDDPPRLDHDEMTTIVLERVLAGRWLRLPVT
jgi:hypothetical protein